MNTPRIPTGEALELHVECIEVTERSIALRAPTNSPEALARAAVSQIMRRAFDPDPRALGAILTTGATVAHAHPGHDTSPQAHDSAAAVWCIAALIAAACVATVRAIVRNGGAA